MNSEILCGKEKLEFGNTEQIRAIDRQTEIIKAQNADKDEEVLKLYQVEFAVSGTAIVDVEAYDQNEAEEKAREHVGTRDIDELDYDFIEATPLRILEDG